MIKELLNKDLIQLTLSGEFKVIIHLCNCFHAMNTGISKKIKLSFPDSFKVDLKTEKESVFKLGEFTKCSIPNLRLTIYNLYGQYRITDNAEYTAIALGLRNIIIDLRNNNLQDSKIAMPKIGCGGNGGLEWKIVKQIIFNEMSEFNLTIVHPQLYESK